MPDTFRSFYERRLAALPFAVERRDLVAAGLHTHVLVAGPRDAPPVLALPGLHFNGPFNLELYASLIGDFRFVSPDMPGQLGMSAQHTPHGRNRYGRWAAALMDALGLESARVCGVSFGGAVALDLAVIAPQRVQRMVLVVPVGIVPVPVPSLLGLAGRGLRYRMSPTGANLRAFAVRLADDPEPGMIELLAAVLRFSRRPVFLPRALPADARLDIDAPTLVIAAARDPVAPGARVVARAARLFSRPPETGLLDATHIPAPEVRRRIAARVGEFLRETR